MSIVGDIYEEGFGKELESILLKSLKESDEIKTFCKKVIYPHYTYYRAKNKIPKEILEVYEIQ